MLVRGDIQALKTIVSRNRAVHPLVIDTATDYICNSGTSGCIVFANSGSNSLDLGDARNYYLGQEFVIYNDTNTVIEVKQTSGLVLTNINPTIRLDVILVDNSTRDGNWRYTLCTQNEAGTNLNIIGDVIASGPLTSNIIATLADVNANTGTFGTSTSVSTIHADEKGRILSITNTPISLSGIGGAPIVSPVFTGNPQAPTQSLTDSSTSIATTEFVQNLITNAIDNILLTFVFDWSDVSVGMFTLPAGKEIVYIQVLVEQAFDGVSPGFTITSGATNLVTMDETDISYINTSLIYTRYSSFLNTTWQANVYSNGSENGLCKLIVQLN